MTGPPRRRTLPRVLATAALVAAIAVAAVLLVVSNRGSGDGDDGGGAAVGSHGQAPAGGVSRVELPDIAKVRNASPQADWGPYSGAVPIFRYHVVGIAPPGAALSELFVAPADFRAQMDWLAARGYEAVGLETVEDAWLAGGMLPAKPVVLSFDGIRGDLLGRVVPELRRRGWPGELVLDTEAPRPRSAAVARLLALGWGLEPSGRDPAIARRFARARFPTPARNFAFRQGASPEGKTSGLRAAGFTGATVTGSGFAEAAHRFELPRITVFNASRIDGFAEAVRSRGNGAGA